VKKTPGFVGQGFFTDMITAPSRFSKQASSCSVFDRTQAVIHARLMLTHTKDHPSIGASIICELHLSHVLAPAIDIGRDLILVQNPPIPFPPFNKNNGRYIVTSTLGYYTEDSSDVAIQIGKCSPF
jgi:hypothetical protein